jgi:hypothetical protein
MKKFIWGNGGAKGGVGDQQNQDKQQNPPLNNPPLNNPPIEKQPIDKQQLENELNVDVTSLDFGLFVIERNDMVIKLLENPDNFSKRLYIFRKYGLFNRRFDVMEGSLIKINRGGICCLSNKTNENLSEQASVCFKPKIKKLVDYGGEFELYKINYKSKDYTMTSQLVEEPLAKFSKTPPVTAKKLSESPNVCIFTNIENYNYLGLDDFSNSFIISYLLYYSYRNDKTKRTGLNGFIEYFTSTLCDADTKLYGVIIKEYPDNGSLYNFITESNDKYREVGIFNENKKEIQKFVLKKSTIVNLLKQIIANLLYLQNEHSFNHGKTTIHTLYVTSESSKISYDGLQNNSDITIKIGDFNVSAMTISTNIGDLRIYNQSSVSNFYFNFSSFTPEIKRSYGETYFTVDSYLTSTLYSKLRHVGIPTYKSWDTATFIISFLSLPEVFYPIMSDVQLKRLLFDEVWHPEDTSKIYTRLYNIVSSGDLLKFDQILDILKGIRIKCNLTTQLFENLKKI